MNIIDLSIRFLPAEKLGFSPSSGLHGTEYGEGIKPKADNGNE